VIPNANPNLVAVVYDTSEEETWHQQWPILGWAVHGDRHADRTPAAEPVLMYPVGHHQLLLLDRDTGNVFELGARTWASLEEALAEKARQRREGQRTGLADILGGLG
jgi:hypothetical protein